MRNVPTPVGAETRASCALYPTPAEYALTNHGSSQPMSSNADAGNESIQKSVVPGMRCPWDGYDLSNDTRRSRTGGHLDAEQAHRPEGQDEYQDREDQRLAPLASEDRPTEYVDDADQEPTDARPHDVADPTEDGRGEGDDSEVEADVPLDHAVVDA